MRLSYNNIVFQTEAEIPKGNCPAHNHNDVQQLLKELINQYKLRNPLISPWDQ